MLLLFSHLVVSNSLQPHGLRHARLPCPLLSLSLLKLMSIESVMPYNSLILCCPLVLLPSIFPSIRVFSSELALRIRWPKYCFFFLCSFFEYDQFLIHIFFCCLYPFELFNLWIVIFFHSYRCLIIFNVTVFCYNFLLFLDWAGWFCVFNSWKVFIFVLCFLKVTCMSSEFFFIFLVHVYFCCIFLDHWSHVTCFLFCFCSEMQSV